MRTTRLERYGGASGVLAVIAIVGAVVFESTGPGPSDSALKLADKFASDRAGVLAGSYLLIAFIALQAVFLAALRGALRRVETDPGILSNLTLGAGLSSFVATAVYVSIYGSLAHGVASKGGPSLVYALFHVANAIDNLGSVFLGIAVIAGSIVIVQTGVFARWIGWLGLVGGGLATLSAFALDESDGPFGLLGLLSIPLVVVWILGASVAMLRRGVATP